MDRSFESALSLSVWLRFVTLKAEREQPGNG
jgi:hypothetical protein